jgi:hypothetical protein
LHKNLDNDIILSIDSDYLHDFGIHDGKTGRINNINDSDIEENNA